MGLVALGLVLGSAITHATWNLAAKRASGTGGLVFIWLRAATSTVIYLPFALWFAHPLSYGALAVMALSAALHASYFLLLHHGYAVGDLSVVYPLARGTGPLLSVTAAILILGDRPGWVGLAGAALVVAGIAVIGLGAARVDTVPAPGVEEIAVLGPDPKRRSTSVPGTAILSGARATGVAYGLAAGVLIAGYTVLDGAAMRTFAIAPVLFDWSVNTIGAAALTPYAARRWGAVAQVWRDHWREVLTIAVLGPLGYILVLYAFTLAPVSLIAPARELSIVVGTLFGAWLLREPQGLRRLAGAAVVVAGVAALALS
ncbi:MAG: EamA family transporter [Micromonosporaceae bacterium]